ncbi:MAG: RNA polymerase sigma factor [Thermoanaerobaculia bacterium]
MNALLDSYLRAQDRESIDATLGELMETDAGPVLRRVVSSRLSGLWDDIDDVCSEARMELLLHLRRIRVNPARDPIADFQAYVAAVAANACNHYFRRRRTGNAFAGAADPRSEVDPDSLPAVSEEPDLAIDRRRFAAILWDEIRRLPRAQRVALLLHLRDRRGNSVLFLFPLCGVASFAEISGTLEISESDLEKLWNDLPSDDNTLAAILSCSRQRVINLRMAARKRLSNRMRSFEAIIHENDTPITRGKL